MLFKRFKKFRILMSVGGEKSVKILCYVFLYAYSRNGQCKKKNACVCVSAMCSTKETLCANIEQIGIKKKSL